MSKSRKQLSYLVYFIGVFLAIEYLFGVTVETDKGDRIFRPLEYSAVIIAVSLVIYFVFRDMAIVIRGKKFTEEE